MAERFIAHDCCALVLETIFSMGHDLTKDLREAVVKTAGARVFAYPVNDPERYGVVEFNHQGKAVSLEEKPRYPKSR